GDLDDVLLRLVDADEEGDLDVGAHVVAADQPLLAPPVDLERLDRDVHDLGLMEDRKDDHPRESDLRLGLHLVDDERLALLDLAVEPREQNRRAKGDQGTDDDDDADQVDSCHFRLLLQFGVLRRRSAERASGASSNRATLKTPSLESYSKIR